MKIDPRKAALIGLAATTVFSVAGCGLNEPNSVNDPPSSIEYQGSEEPTETPSDTPGPLIRPDYNNEEPVYGPPEWFE